MPQFLTISPTHVRGKKKFAWDNFRKGGYIALGWYHQDYTGWSIEEIAADIRAQGFKNEAEAIEAHTKLLALNEGDLVAVNNASQGIFGIGRVKSSYRFKERMHDTGDQDPNEFYSHYREVEWLVTDYRPKRDLVLSEEIEWAPYGTVGKLYAEVPAWVGRALERRTPDEASVVRVTPAAFEKAFAKFNWWAENIEGGCPFTDFGHVLVSPRESYKKEVFTDAKAQLLTQFWKTDVIGSGEIHVQVNKALRPKVIHKGLEMENNLLDWRLKDDFSKMREIEALEQVLFDFYKSKRSDEACFLEFMELGLAYQLIAYLFFLKDRERYLPISQQGFDDAFAELGVVGFKTSGKLSWENYSTFLDLNKQLKGYLGERLGAPVELLDAHSFAWCIGHTFPSWERQLLGQEAQAADTELEGEGRFAPESLTSGQVAVQDFHDELVFPEGQRYWIAHKKSERNAEVVRIAKERFKQEDPLMRCQVCGFSFAERYGAQGIGYIEAHHVLPVSEMKEGHMTKPEDLVMVCSNCHVMLHRKRPWLHHEELIKLLGAS